MKNNSKAILLATISLFASGSSLASECLQPHTENIVLSGKSQAIPRQQARRTWEDWIWRGPIFKCPGNGNTGCPYRWDNTKTTGYSWSVGASLNLSKIPVVGGALSILGISGNYSQNKSLTTTYSWTINTSPGYYAQPIQVIQRRWTSGEYRGAYQNTGLGCSFGIASPVTRSWYNWNNNIIAGKWNANIDVGRYATYHIYK